MPQGQFEDFPLDLNTDFLVDYIIKSCIRESTADALAALYHKTLHKAVPEHANTGKKKVQ